MLEQNTVRTVGKAESKTVGKKQILLEFNPDKGWVMGVGLEASTAMLVYLNAAGTVIGHERVEVGNDANVLPNLLRASADAWAAKNNKQMDELMGVGVGVPGVVDSERGYVLRSTIFHTQDLPLHRLLSEQFDVPVRVDNDANFAALAESRMGSARGLFNFVYFLMIAMEESDGFAVRGLGSTIFLNGRLYRGSHYAAGEIDSMLEAEPYAKTSYEQLRLLAEPDSSVDDEMRHLARQVGRTLTPVVDLLDPQAVVLGGNLGICNRQMIDEIAREMNQNLVKVPNREVSIHPSELIDRGISMGAAIAAIDAALVGDEPAQLPNSQAHLAVEVTSEPNAG